MFGTPFFLGDWETELRSSEYREVWSKANYDYRATIEMSSCGRHILSIA